MPLLKIKKEKKIEEERKKEKHKHFIFAWTLDAKFLKHSCSRMLKPVYVCVFSESAEVCECWCVAAETRRDTAARLWGPRCARFHAGPGIRCRNSCHSCPLQVLASLSHSHSLIFLSLPFFLYLVYSRSLSAIPLGAHEEDGESDGTYCVACNKGFKSAKQ